MERKELYEKLYDKLLDADVLDINNFNSETDLKKAVIEIAEDALKDYIILRGELVE